MEKITRQKALYLLPLIVDNEASEEEKNAFFRYIHTDDDVRKKYESLLFIKQLLKTKYTPENAPKHLKENISALIEDLKKEQNEESVEGPAIFSVSDKADSQAEQNGKERNSASPDNFKKVSRYLAAAAVLLIFSLLTIELLERASTNNFHDIEIEELALSHFISGEQASLPDISYLPESPHHAMQLLEDEMSHQPKLPEINGASLRRIIYTSVIDGFETPVLEFYQDDINETVHVFAFRLNDLKKQYKMKRDPEAVKNCKTNKDYHIKNIEGKHVVSWKWGDYWYIAVSNHDGYDLIALVQPPDTN